MKYFLTIILISIYSNINNTTIAQESISLPDCHDSSVHHRLVATNASYENVDYSLQRFQTIQIPSNTYVPILINLFAEHDYVFNMVLQDNYQQFFFQLIDVEKQNLFQRKGRNKKNKHASNIITERFQAPYTGYYWLILSQNAKKEDNTCAGISILLSNEE